MLKKLKIPQSLGLLLLTCCLVLTLRLPAIAQTPQHYKDLTFPPLGEIKIPEYERFTLKNGLVVYLMEDHQLPLVNGTALIRTGSRLEPANQVGLADLTATVLRTGGTTQHTSAQINELLEQRAAKIETNMGVSNASISFSSLTADIEPVFQLFAEILRKPAFSLQQIELAKTQERGAIARRNDDPGDIASREFQKAIYGANSPYGRTVEYSTLDNISPADIERFYQTYIRPDQIILGIVGDFDPQKMKALLEATLGDWQVSTPAPSKTIPPATAAYTGGVFLVDIPQLTQSNIFLGHIGGKLDSPDYPALSVVNEVLNGFSGRLFNQIRSRQGLAYSVYGTWSANYDYPGYFIAGGQTRSDASVPFVKSILQEIERLRQEPITETELNNAKESILNSFVFKFENPGQTLSRLLAYEYYGYPQDFIFRYQAAIKAMTAAQVQQAAQKYLQPEKMVTVVVGNSQGMQPSLSTLGEPVKVVDVTIPAS
jgi:zinc protease